MIVGITILVALHLLHLTFVNMLLLIPLCLILVGLLLHVRSMKKESLY